MPRVKHKTKEQDLARIRTNQRRCRQRKRDYVVELEQRLAVYETTTAEEIRQLKARNDELVKENERLLSLLEPRDPIQPVPAQSSPETDSGEPVKDTHVVADLMDSIDSAKLDSLPSITDPRETPLSPLALWDNQASPPPLGSFNLSADVPLPDASLGHLPPQPHGNFDESLSLIPRDLDVDVSNMLTGTVLQDTTLCTVAFELVMHCNKRNVSVFDLDMKLSCGYRNAESQWEGCRVDNRVLLAVLAEITR